MTTPALQPVAEWLIGVLAAGTERPTAMLDVPPASDLPYVVVSGVPSGGSAPDACALVGVVRASFQVDTVAATALEASGVADLVLAALAGEAWPVELVGGPSVTAWELTLAGQPMRRSSDPRALVSVPHTIAVEVRP